MLTKRHLPLIGLAALALAPATASAKHGADDNGGGGGGGNNRTVLATGHCGAGATSKLKLKNDDGRIEVEFEVDNNRSGTPWRVTLARDGRVVYRATRRTGGRSGSFSVEKRIANLAGADRVTARAVGPNGNTCTAAATLPA
jgi:hypothetical protein